MAKYTEDFSTFNYNWEQVSQGFWRRYPNPYASHVLTEDTLQREVRQDGKLYSKRILSKTNRVPKWGERFFKSKSVFIVEESIVDPANKTLTTLTRNIGFNKIMSVVEKVVYKVDSPGKTIAHRSAWIDSQVFGFAGAIRAFGCDRFRKNCQKTVMGFEYILGILFPLQHPGMVIMHHDVASKFKEVAKSAGEHVKEQIYQASKFNVNQN